MMALSLTPQGRIEIPPNLVRWLDIEFDEYIALEKSVDGSYWLGILPDDRQRPNARKAEPCGNSVICSTRVQTPSKTECATIYFGEHDQDFATSYIDSGLWYCGFPEDALLTKEYY